MKLLLAMFILSTSFAFAVPGEKSGNRDGDVATMLTGVEDWQIQACEFSIPTPQLCSQIAQDQTLEQRSNFDRAKEVYSACCSLGLED